LSFATTVAADAGSYVCEVSGACTPIAISSSATLTIAAGSSIINHPNSQNICTGASAVFVCDATGGSLTYQWKKDGVALTNGGNIAGATTFTLTVASSVLGDAGSYVCEVSSTCSSMLISNSATLSINTATAISSQPSSLTLCAGAPASFSISATGSGLVYQWTKGGTAISSATNSSYTIPSTVVADAGSYKCDITSACGFLSSTVATLTVDAPVSITTQPTNLSACPGDNITFSVLTTGTVASYQWKKNGVALVDGGNISNATTNVLAIASVSASDVDTYTCDVVAVCGANSTSSIAALTLSSTPTITTQPTNTLICTGQVLNLTIVANSGSTIIYQWQKDGVDLVNNAIITGANTATLSISSTTSADAGNYTCSVATSCSAPAVSNVAVVSTTTSSSITQQPISANVCKTQSVLFTVTISGSGIVYQWQYKANAALIYTNLSNGGKYSGVATNALVITNADISEEGAYRCVVTEACGAVQNSAPAALRIDSPNIIINPFPQSLCLGQLVQFSVVATGSNLVYQWYKDGVALVNGGRISGARAAALSITGAVISDNGDYTCSVTGICPPPVTSQPGTLTVSVCTAISIADLNGQIINIYPKPANNETTIEIKGRSGEITIGLFDMQGSLVLSDLYNVGSSADLIRINTSALPQGVYVVQIQIGEELYTDKLHVIH
jgi:hypothetical protein